MRHLLTEMSLIERFHLQINKLENKVKLAENSEGESLTIEQVGVIALRTRKLFQVQDDLVDVFRIVHKFELVAPLVKKFLYDNQEQQNIKVVLKKEAISLREVVDELHVKEDKLYERYAFFRRPFIFCDKDYLHFVEREMKELRNLFA